MGGPRRLEGAKGGGTTEGGEITEGWKDVGTTEGAERTEDLKSFGEWPAEGAEGLLGNWYFGGWGLSSAGDRITKLEIATCVYH